MQCPEVNWQRKSQSKHTLDLTKVSPCHESNIIKSEQRTPTSLCPKADCPCEAAQNPSWHALYSRKIHEPRGAGYGKSEREPRAWFKRDLLAEKTYGMPHLITMIWPITALWGCMMLRVVSWSDKRKAKAYFENKSCTHALHAEDIPDAFQFIFLL